MSKYFLKLIILFLIINCCYTQLKEEINQEEQLRLLKPSKEHKTKKTKNTKSSKPQYKLLQTLYSDSYSNNYYYTTLYIGSNKFKQTYIIDTSSTIMSSPCNTCKNCGKLKKNYYDNLNRKFLKPLKCSSKICEMVPTTGCSLNIDTEEKTKKDKDLDLKTCSFYTKKSNGEGIKGYYLNNIVFFEEDKILTSYKKKQLFRSYSLPIGCTTGEFGKFKSYKIDGIMGLNNEKKSFIDILYNFKVINKNLFSICLGLEGGYMSFEQIDKTYHLEKTINYVPFYDENNLYSIYVYGIKVGNNKQNYTKLLASIDSSNPYSYIPKHLFKSIYSQFTELCTNEKGENICGHFYYDSQLGYCAPFNDRESLFKTINENWPNITLFLEKKEKGKFIWKPINYYYYYIQNDIRKACFGLHSHEKDFIIFGSNFMHGNDIIFDRENKLIGYVPADCSRRNILMKGIINSNQELDAIMLDKEIHQSEKEGKFKLGDEDYNKDTIEFVKGNIKELYNNNEFKLKHISIIFIFIFIIITLILIILVLTMINPKDSSSYPNYSEESSSLSFSQKLEEENTDNRITNQELQFLKKIIKKADK